ncbi:MAG: transposase zinc-binding domain-containing protein [Planctomycetota bacterium]
MGGPRTRSLRDWTPELNWSKVEARLARGPPHDAGGDASTATSDAAPVRGAAPPSATQRAISTSPNDTARPRVRSRSGWSRRAVPGSGAPCAPRATASLARLTSCSAIRRAASYIVRCASTRDLPRALRRPHGGRTLPAHVERELRAAITCGDLAHGFWRVRCQSCALDHLVTFSCKGAGSARHAVAGVWPRLSRTSRATWSRTCRCGSGCCRSLGAALG